MKEYPKTYEDVYTREKAVGKCKIEHVTTDKGMSSLEYMDLSRKFLSETMEGLFNAIVKFVWLQHRFTYMGYRRKKTGGNFYLVDGAFGVFMRHHVGIEYRVFSRNFYYSRVSTYMSDFFPEFSDRNPFEEPEYYKYPYKHVTMDFLTIVNQMPQRLELLQLAEDRKMKWDEFMDYVINFALCYNDEKKKNEFTIINPTSVCPPYVRYNRLKTTSRKKLK